MNMSTPLEEKINALQAKIDEYESLPLAERAQWKEVITESRRTLNKLLDTQASATAATAEPVRISVADIIMNHRVRPSEPFTTALESPLPFKIPVPSMLICNRYPQEFEYGVAEYESAVESWLNSNPLMSGSEAAVVALDYQWQLVLKCVCRISVMLNEKDPSSQIRLRPDFTGLLNNVLVIKAEAKNSSIDLPTAVSELTSKFHETARLMFPRDCPIIPGIATSRELICLYRIYYDDSSKRFCSDLVKQYYVSDILGKKDFIVDIFKIARWIVSQATPTDYFHLVSNVRIKTRNNHHVTLQSNGIVKEFYHNNARPIPMDIIKAIYEAKLPNVENGETNSKSITITTVGRRLQDAIRLFGLDKREVLTQVQLAVKQLHDIGYAHCDICADNIFVTVNENVVFLGDLEYCQLKENPPPSGIRRGDPSASTAEELDMTQLDRFRDELVLL